jgi:hypothetical protein
MTKLPVAFQNFTNAPKNVYILSAGRVIHKRHYTRNPVFFSHKKLPERGFAQLTAPNTSVGRGVTVMNDNELNLFLVTARRLTVWVGRLSASVATPLRLSSPSATVLWASAEEPVTIG